MRPAPRPPDRPSEAVVAYRGMTAVRERLCAELRLS
jgi:hypothetical protein